MNFNSDFYHLLIFLSIVDTAICQLMNGLKHFNSLSNIFLFRWSYFSQLLVLATKTTVIYDSTKQKTSLSFW